MKVKVIVIEPMKAPEIREIENTGQGIHEVVDGYIEVACAIGALHVLCNEEFHFRPDLKSNRVLPDGQTVRGNMVVVRSKGSDYVSVTAADVETVNRIFGQQVVVDL